MAMVRILFLGENWYGSCARACCYALRRLGCNVLDLDVQTFFPPWRSLWMRGTRRLLAPHIAKEYNDSIRDCAKTFRPDILLVFKGPLVYPSTVRDIKALGIKTYNYYPDTSAFVHSKHIPGALREYDAVFGAHKHFVSHIKRALQLKTSLHLPHGYDPDIHRPYALDEKDLSDFTCDVVFVAFHTQYKEALIDQALALAPEMNMDIRGRGWQERCASSRVRACIRGPELTGENYSKALIGAKIALGITSGPVGGAAQGDETTTRTFEIPACGGFMLHERTPELRDYFEEDSEVGCFNGATELVEKVKYYLELPQLRKIITEKSHSRCVPCYSYEERMKRLLSYHFGNPDCAARNVASSGVPNE